LIQPSLRKLAGCETVKKLAAGGCLEAFIYCPVGSSARSENPAHSERQEARIPKLLVDGAAASNSELEYELIGHHRYYGRAARP
jgi:hypothetical protein